MRFLSVRKIGLLHIRYLPDHIAFGETSYKDESAILTLYLSQEKNKKREQELKRCEARLAKLGYIYAWKDMNALVYTYIHIYI